MPAHPTPRAKFPFVDVHSHHRAASLTAAEVDELVRQMDALNMAVMVNLSGGSGETLAEGIRNLSERYPNRFVTFANVSYEGIDDPAYGERAAAQLAADVAAGARGLKIFKDLGMFAKDASGQRIPTNDPRLDPIWAKCAELGIPVLIHTGEPSPFFEPHDRFNERWLELKERPGRKRHSHWQLYGLDLPDEVLRKIYFENALRVVPGLDRALFPARD